MAGGAWRGSAVFAFACWAIACSATPDEESFADPGPEPLSGVAGVRVTALAAYQPVKVPLFDEAGAVATSLPLVAKRAALVRAFVATDEAYDGGEVTARLDLGDGDPIEVTAPAVMPSNDADLASTMNFEVPAGQLEGEASLSIEVGRVGGEGKAARLPADEPLPLSLASIGDSVKIKLVPVAYQGDGSGRLPDLSDAQLAAYHDALLAMYPAPAVDLTVREPLDWSTALSPFGNGWDQLLMAIADLRQKDAAPPDVYYYGVFAPAPSMGAWCSGGCVAGLSMAGGPHDAFSRASIGLGFTGNDAVLIALHEIGHAHGRMHAPCQTFDSDPGYPHAGGRTGVWGYDPVGKRLMSPETPDIMGYCTPQWISDYTFAGLLERVRTVNQAMALWSAAPRQSYARIRVSAAGDAWLSPIDLDQPPSAEPVTVAVDLGGRSQAVQGQYYPFDHLEGGVLLVPGPVDSIRTVRAIIGSRSLTLTR